MLGYYRSEAVNPSPVQDGLLTAPVLCVGAVREYRPLRLQLEQSGLPAHQVASCAGALRILTTRRTAAVVVDELAAGGWRSVLAACNALNEPPPVIVVSARADALAEVLLAGGFDVLPKAFTVESAARLVSVAFQRWRREQEQLQARRQALQAYAAAAGEGH